MRWVLRDLVELLGYLGGEGRGGKGVKGVGRFESQVLRVDVLLPWNVLLRSSPEMPQTGNP